MYLSGIILPCEALSRSGAECSGHRDCIESYYNDIVRCLNLASQCVPCARDGIAKHWWNANLNDLKRQCMRSISLVMTNCPQIGVGKIT